MFNWAQDKKATFESHDGHTVLPGYYRILKHLPRILSDFVMGVARRLTQALEIPYDPSLTLAQQLITVSMPLALQ